MKHDVLILGASTRAAAFSAIRHGLRPYCLDYFADRDLAAVCPVVRIDPEDAANQFAGFAEAHPCSPWFYTSGFENHPEWVERISRKHQPWGMDAAAVRAVRDPLRVADVLRESKITCPAVRPDSRDLPRDGSWLVKPRHSGGGRGIEPLTREDQGRYESHYLQEAVEGPSFSALFIGDRIRSRLIGVTRQWIGVEGSPFVYRGSIGPWPIGASLGTGLQSLGDRLVSAFGLVGWFGVDYVLNGGLAWPVEVNPRYSASFEIYELSSGHSLVPIHRRVCDGNANQDGGLSSASPRRPRSIAKLILYAHQQVIVPEIVADENESEGPYALNSIADVPAAGTRFQCGDPVMTILAAGEDLASCEENLRRRERKWRERLSLDPC